MGQISRGRIGERTGEEEKVGDSDFLLRGPDSRLTIE
jgi:hypothetical protein